MTDIRFFGKRPLAITAMNVEFLPFKNGENNSECASKLDYDITPRVCARVRWLHQ